MTDKPLSPVEKVKEESRGLRGDLAAQLSAGGDHFSDAGAQLLKFHGTYQQEDRDQRRALRGTDAEASHQFMVRCKIPGGALTREQYLVIDELADRYGNGTLRVTTRQGNQFHGVLKGDLKATIRSVNDALVTTLGACGDVVRNVISCPAPLPGGLRSEEHTSELQSPCNLVCRLLLEKKKNNKIEIMKKAALESDVMLY